MKSPYGLKYCLVRKYKILLPLKLQLPITCKSAISLRVTMRYYTPLTQLFCIPYRLFIYTQLQVYPHFITSPFAVKTNTTLFTPVPILKRATEQSMLKYKVWPLRNNS